MKESYYFLGIGGSAMGQVAMLLKSEGHAISGADTNVYPPMSHLLNKANIPYDEGYSVEALLAKNPGKIVIGNALSRGNPIIEWLWNNQQFEYISLPELIGSQLIAKRNSIVISGTHGKTTTTAATAFLLESLGKHPGYLIGGAPQNLPQGASLGASQSCFVIEGDEYDSAFFDKRSKFIHYHPHILAIGNIEFDHADIFRDLEDVKRTFRHAIALVPSSGCIIYNGDDPTLASLLPVSWTTSYSVGTSPLCSLFISDFQSTSEGIAFELVWKGKPWTIIKSPLFGEFNARNLAIAALSTGLSLSPKDPTVVCLDALNRFTGVKRRQEVRHQCSNWTVIEDFGHHPTAIEHTLKALQKHHPASYLWALLEPRSNTLASKTFEAILPKSLLLADRVSLAPVHRGNLKKAGETLDTVAIAKQISSLSQGQTTAQAFDQLELLLEDLKTYSHDGHKTVVFFSNGGFGGVLPKFLEYLSK